MSKPSKFLVRRVCTVGWCWKEGEGSGCGSRRGLASSLGAPSKNTTGRRRHLFWNTSNDSAIFFGFRRDVTKLHEGAAPACWDALSLSRDKHPPTDQPFGRIVLLEKRLSCAWWMGGWMYGWMGGWVSRWVCGVVRGYVWDFDSACVCSPGPQRATDCGASPLVSRTLGRLRRPTPVHVTGGLCAWAHRPWSCPRALCLCTGFQTNPQRPSECNTTLGSASCRFALLDSGTRRERQTVKFHKTAQKIIFDQYFCFSPRGSGKTSEKFEKQTRQEKNRQQEEFLLCWKRNYWFVSSHLSHFLLHPYPQILSAPLCCLPHDHQRDARVQQLQFQKNAGLWKNVFNKICLILIFKIRHLFHFFFFGAIFRKKSSDWAIGSWAHLLGSSMFTSNPQGKLAAWIAVDGKPAVTRAVASYQMESNDDNRAEWTLLENASPTHVASLRRSLLSAWYSTTTCLNHAGKPKWPSTQSSIVLTYVLKGLNDTSCNNMNVTIW